MHSILRQMDVIKPCYIRQTFLYKGQGVIVSEGILAFLDDQTYYWVNLRSFQLFIKYHDAYTGNLCKIDSTT